MCVGPGCVPAQQLDYGGLQQLVADGEIPEALRWLPDVGTLRQKQARARHAINLDLPEQAVVVTADGASLQLRQPLPVEDWNAEISLLTGVCAARLMLGAGYGILRTVPPPTSKLGRRAAAARARPGGAVAAGGRTRRCALDPAPRRSPRGRLPRSGGEPAARGRLLGLRRPAAGAAVARRNWRSVRTCHRAPAPAGRPLRQPRSAWPYTRGNRVPDWVRAALPTLPATMAAADHRAHAVDRAVVDMTEAWLLRDRVGELFDAVVLDADDHAATIAVSAPAVRARCSGGGLRAGDLIKARLVSADVATRTVRFER